MIPVDNDEDEMTMVGAAPEGALIADAGDLPLEDASVDGAFCSNLLEHTPDAAAVIREIERVLRPGGWGYISWTNWYSPWGGHDMSPYHYLGPERGPRLYEQRHGPRARTPTAPGSGRARRPDDPGRPRAAPACVERIEPRYWPRLAFLLRSPGCASSSPGTASSASSGVRTCSTACRAG